MKPTSFFLGLQNNSSEGQEMGAIAPVHENARKKKFEGRGRSRP
jgi:hypothetical protein